jgi:hypothetical protein
MDDASQDKTSAEVQHVHATLASGAAVPSSAAATLPATAAAVAPRAAAVLPATAASGGSGARLPPYVVACNNLDGRVRYGVEVKIPGQKGQMRVGSAFADPKSAWLAARVFQSSAIIDAATGDIVLNHAASGLYNPLHMCSIFRAPSMCITEECVVDVLVDILTKRSARIRVRASKRKRSSEADGGGGAAAGGARAAAAQPPAAAPVAAARESHAAAAAAAASASASAAAASPVEQLELPTSALGPISGPPDSSALAGMHQSLSPLTSTNGGGVMGFSPQHSAMSLTGLLSGRRSVGSNAFEPSWLDSAKVEGGQPWNSVRAHGGGTGGGGAHALNAIDRIDSIDSARGNGAAAAAAAQRLTTMTAPVVRLASLTPQKIPVGTSRIVEAKGANFSSTTNFFATTQDNSGRHRCEMLQTWRGDDTTRCMVEVHGIDVGTYRIYASNDYTTFSNLLPFSVVKPRTSGAAT